jgi:hypothetical protein
MDSNRLPDFLVLGQINGNTETQEKMLVPYPWRASQAAGNTQLALTYARGSFRYLQLISIDTHFVYNELCPPMLANFHFNGTS